MLDKDKVIELYCSLSAEVMRDVYQYSIPADCICKESTGAFGGSFQFDEEILSFIETAVHKAIEEYKGGK